MDNTEEKKIREGMEDFHLPRWREIPDVGLYLEQTSQYIGDYLAPLGDISVTGSMISNYVKKKMIANPVRKRYGREQIADLVFISAAKTVLSLENVTTLLELQRSYCAPEQAYNSFCDEFENALRGIFGTSGSLSPLKEEADENMMLLHRTILTAACKIYLDKCFDSMKEAHHAG